MPERRHVNEKTGEIIDDPAIRPFADFLRDMSRGQTHDQMSEALWDLVARVQETGKKGSLSLTIHLEPMKGSEHVTLVHDKIDLKLPEHARTPSIFYTDSDGNLSRDDPDQPSFEFLRDVSGAVLPSTDDLKEAK